jgi:hypothetical protein
MSTSSAYNSRAISFDHRGAIKSQVHRWKANSGIFNPGGCGKNDIFMVSRLYLSLATFRGSYLKIEKIVNSAFCFSLSYLSQDMIAEKISQASHCFSISTNPDPKNSTILSGTNKVIILPEMVNAVICPETGKSLKHQELITKLRYKIKWMRSTTNEISRLYKTNTIRFICRSNIPKGRKVMYGLFVVDIKEHKEEKERTRLTVGGDQIEYPGNKSTRTACLTTSKILINSGISTLGAKFLLIDINIFYVNTPLGRFEYMVINLSSLPQETINKYDFIELSQDGKVYIEIQKGMYGLPQAALYTLLQLSKS